MRAICFLKSHLLIILSISFEKNNLVNRALNFLMCSNKSNNVLIEFT